jgi:hypothetical protein
VRFQDLMVASMMFRIVFWDVLPCKMIVDNNFTRQYIPDDNSEHHTRRRENLKSHIGKVVHFYIHHAFFQHNTQNQTLLRFSK